MHKLDISQLSSIGFQMDHEFNCLQLTSLFGYQTQNNPQFQHSSTLHTIRLFHKYFHQFTIPTDNRRNGDQLLNHTITENFS